MLLDNFKLKGQGADVAKNVAQAVVNEITQERLAKGINLVKNWDMYNAKHSKYFMPRKDEAADIFAYRQDNAVVENLVGFSVNLSARYLYGRASKVVRKYSKDKNTQKRMAELAKLIELDNFLLDCAKKAPIFGKQPIRLVPVDKLTKMQPEGGKSTKTTYPHPIQLDPLNSFIKRNKWGKIVAAVIRYRSTDWAKNEVNEITELIVEDSRWMWKDTGNIAAAFQSLAINPTSMVGAGDFVRQPNTVPLAYEFVDMINNPDEVSDIEGIMDLNIALDEALTDNKHFYSRHGWPQLVTEVSLKEAAKNPNYIWEITPDSDDGKKVLDRLGFLTWDGKMTDKKEFVENLERMIFILSNTAAISTGDLKAIGQLRSGAALITAHSVAIHKTEEKQIIWEQNEKKLFQALANYDSYLQGEKVESRYRDLDPVIRFSRDFVPGAEAERAQIQQMELNSHMKPLRDILQEKYPDADEETIEEKYKEILKDSEEIVDSLRKFETEQTGVSGKSGTSMKKSKEQTKPKE